MRPELALIEDVIAAGQEVDAVLEEFLRRLNRQAEAAGEILAVGDAGVNGKLFPQDRDASLDRIPPRTAHHIADQKDTYGPLGRYILAYERLEAFAFRLDFKK